MHNMKSQKYSIESTIVHTYLDTFVSKTHTYVRTYNMIIHTLSNTHSEDKVNDTGSSTTPLLGNLRLSSHNTNRTLVAMISK